MFPECWQAMSVTGLLFQARMWREYAQAWDGKANSSGVGRDWCRSVLQVSRQDCIKNAKQALKLASAKNAMRKDFNL